ncbi:hypothetical protein ACGFZB_28835 [Streptomyces cinerochromogenes]|uniref:Uncharacterized protein n=1 Tax=Streptomyces cinerochromogenes TaxID=66422 RepID=A0ABW7BAX6_9ACTN
MTEYTAQCRHNEADKVIARIDGPSVELMMSPGDEYAGEAYLSPDAARTFARGILTLADEIDGGEAKEEPKPEPVKVGDRVRIVRATYADHTHGREGVVTSTSETWRNIYGDQHPYIVRLDGYDGDTVHVAELERVPTPADEPITPANPRADFITQARALLDDYAHTVDDVLTVARFLACE